MLGQLIGRWGNFMNGEAHGGETDIFIRMGLDFGYGMKYYHPTFLYESLWNLVGFILINIFFKHKKYDGQLILLTNPIYFVREDLSDIEIPKERRY